MNAIESEGSQVDRSYLWQAHFDRDLTSPAELLQIPVVGPNLLTQRLRFGYQPPRQQTLVQADRHQVSGAAAMFLQPEFDPVTDSDSHADNSWYRLFEFVEVPSRVNSMLGNYLQRTTVPGKINLNSMRHMAVLAGLLDTPMAADFDTDDQHSPFLAAHTPGDPLRDAWLDFLKERDGVPVAGYYDPTPAAPESGDESKQVILPGVPGSRPFRSSGFSTSTIEGHSTDHTILRRLMIDRDENGDGVDDEMPGSDIRDKPGIQLTNRHWLEVGGATLHASPADGTTPVERYQLLSKVLNNTTTVSNTFVVFSTAAYFEAWEDPESGLFRIGGRVDLDGDDQQNPGWQQRGVFVIDRTEAIEAWDPVTQRFDWKRLVKYQAEIE